MEQFQDGLKCSSCSLLRSSRLDSSIKACSIQNTMESFTASSGFSSKKASEASTKVKYSNNLGTLTPLLGYGIQGSLAFGSNELFKELITYFDRKRSSEPYTIMPMSHILLSGAFTGMVSTLAIVTIALYKTPADHTRIIMQK